MLLRPGLRLILYSGSERRIDPGPTFSPSHLIQPFMTSDRLTDSPTCLLLLHDSSFSCMYVRVQSTVRKGQPAPEPNSDAHAVAVAVAVSLPIDGWGKLIDHVMAIYMGRVQGDGDGEGGAVLAMHSVEMEMYCQPAMPPAIDVANTTQ
jgi:hypothetical protein